jgi:hypothetical protein
MDKSPEMIDQLSERRYNKPNANLIDDPVCDLCKNRHVCPESAKNLAKINNNECHDSC